MKVFALVIALVCLPLTLQSQEVLGPGWATYQMEVSKVQFEYPAHWVAQKLDQSSVLISPGDISESGLPAFPNPWVIASEARGGSCPVGSRGRIAFDFQRRGNPRKDHPRTVFHEAYTCRAGVEFLLGFYDTDPAKKEREALLKIIVERGLRRVD